MKRNWRRRKRMRIDVHNHFYPTRFLKELEKDGAAIGITIEKDEWGRQILVQKGNRVVTYLSYEQHRKTNR
jgi:hypothetical protein